jgi:proline dehydrogenase
MLDRALLRVSRSQGIKKLVTRAPVTSDVVSRFVAGEDADDAVAAARRLSTSGLRVSIDHLGEYTTDRAHADKIVSAYLDLLERLHEAGLSAWAEVSVKLTALGQGLPDGERIALENTKLICGAARTAGMTVTVDMEDHTTTDSTLGIVRELRKDFPDTGAVLQAYLYRTEQDCRDLAYAGSRVRLCKGAYSEPENVAFKDTNEIDRSYVRCLKILMAGAGYPMLATHDPRLVQIGQRLATDNERPLDSYEFQMLYGIRPMEQRRLANLGHLMRVYIPYGTDWYGYLIRRLAERPANLTFFARALVSKN